MNNTILTGIEPLNDNVCLITKVVVAINLDAYKEADLRKANAGKGVAEKNGKMFMVAFNSREDALLFVEAIK